MKKLEPLSSDEIKANLKLVTDYLKVMSKSKHKLVTEIIQKE